MQRLSLFLRIYLIVTVIISVIMAFLGYDFVKCQKNLLIEEKKNLLFQVATNLERKFDNNDMAEQITAVKALPIGDKEKRIILNSIYQPLTDAISIEYPDVGLGIYSKELGVLSIGPIYNSEYLISGVANPRFLNLYQTHKIEYIESDNSLGWDGKPIIAVSYPLVYKGEIIGHTWANIKTEDVDREVFKLVPKIIGFGIIIWVITVFLIFLCFKKMRESIRQVSNSIAEQNDTIPIEHIPELDSLLKTVIALRENIKQEYYKRIEITEELSKIDRLNIVGELAASVTHEIRNPMTTIQGYLQLLKKKHPEMHAYLDTALEELKSVNTIIEDYLTLARNQFVEKKECNLNDLILKIEPLIYSDCVKGGIELKIELDPTFPVFLFSIREIQQLILNLSRNAVDAMLPNGVLTIKTVSQGHLGKLIITDTGSGIPEEDIPKIFEPFFTTKANGTGLGMPVCLGIIERHSGKIKVYSEVGLGTTFEISFTK